MKQEAKLLHLCLLRLASERQTGHLSIISQAWRSGADWLQRICWNNIETWNALLALLLAKNVVDQAASLPTSSKDTLSADSIQAKLAEETVNGGLNISLIRVLFNLLDTGQFLGAVALLQHLVEGKGTSSEHLTGNTQWIINLGLPAICHHNETQARNVLITVMELLHADTTLLRAQAGLQTCQKDGAPMSEGYKGSAQLLKGMVERPFNAKASSMTPVKQDSEQQRMASWICLLATADTCNWSQPEVRRMILLNFHKPGLQHHLLRITTPSLETLSPECQPKQSQLQDLLSIAANIEKCKLVGEPFVGNGRTDLVSQVSIQAHLTDQPMQSLRDLLCSIEQGGATSVGGDQTLESLLAVCRGRGLAYMAKWQQLYLPNKPLQKFVFLLKGLLKGGMYAESNGEQSLTGTVPSRRPLADPQEAVHESAAWWALLTCLDECCSPEGRHRLFVHLTKHDIPISSPTLQLTIKCLVFLYETLGCKAAEASWNSKAPWKQDQIVQGIDTDFVTSKLIETKSWEAAARWQEMIGQPKDWIIVQQARCLLDEWRELLPCADDDLRVWEELHCLFLKNGIPPWTAAQFFVHQAAGLSGDASADCKTQSNILKIARRWLDGSVSGGKQDCPAAVLRELSAAIQLCDPAPTNHIVDGEGFVPLALSQSMQEPKMQADRSQGSGALPSQGCTYSSSLSEMWDMLHETVRSLVAGASSAANVQSSVRSLLEAGDMIAARALSKQLPSPPIELALVEAAVRIFRTVQPSLKASSEASFVGIVPAAVVAFLRRRGFVISNTTDLLASLSRSCRAGAGGAVCRWVQGAWNAALVLSLPTAQIVALGPLSTLEALILNDAEPQVVRDFATASRLPESAVAALLAKLFFKGLLLRQTWRGEENTARVWTVDTFIDLMEGSTSAVEVANALLQLLLERHSALPAQVEVEVILAAHRLYNENDCLDGIDGLVELTTLSVTRWANQQQYKALASLAAGMGRYKPVRQAIDLLIQSDNLETLLQRSPAAIESHGVVGLSMKKLVALASVQRSGSSMQEQIVLHHFGLERQLAESAFREAKESQEQRLDDRLAHQMARIEGHKTWLQAASSNLQAGSYCAAAECAVNIVHRIDGQAI